MGNQGQELSAGWPLEQSPRVGGRPPEAGEGSGVLGMPWLEVSPDRK